MARTKLTRDQHKQLAAWLATNLPYSKLAAKMQACFGFTITPSSVTWHRKNNATLITRIQARRERDRRAKQHQRAGIAHQHCPTCQCTTA